MNIRRLQTATLAAVALAMGAVFLVSVPKVSIDRVSESWAEYFKLPYTLIEQGNVVVRHKDPFPENGPQAVYPPAAIAFFTGSLFLTRAYQFAFSMLAVALLGALFFRKFGDRLRSSWEVPVYGAIFLAAWLSIPLSLVYPIQVNGMLGGVACLVLGMSVYRRSVVWGMFCFGWAFSFKGQFLALLPGFILYTFLLDVRESSLPKHFGKAFLALAMFFVPKTVILSGLCAALGMFESTQEFVKYAFDGPSLIGYEFLYIVGRFLGAPAAAAPEEGVRRSVEYAGFGVGAWGHIVLSAGFSALFAARSVWKRFRPSVDVGGRYDRGLAVFAWGALFYWINYLFFYRFPYWYNVLAVVYVNIFLVAAGVLWLRDLAARFLGARWANVFLIVFGIGSLVYVGKSVRFLVSMQPGDALTPYEWMRPAQ